MIRLGSAAGYPFEGPRLLAGWTRAGPSRRLRDHVQARPRATSPSSTPSSTSATATTCRTERFPFRHPRAACWTKRAGDKWKIYIATYEAPGGSRAHREQIARELTAIYRPGCNDQQYDLAWKDEWIGDYNAPTTSSVTRRGPDKA